MDGLCNSGKFPVEAGGRLAQRLAQVQWGAGNGGGHNEGQYGSTASRNHTQTPLKSVSIHRQGV